MPDSIKNIQERLALFSRERNWDQFHSPKNLVMALAGESGELIELFQWLTEEQSRTVITDEKAGGRVREEMADIFLYLLRLADILDIDLIASAESKIASNERKYPIHLSHGNAVKYSRRDELTDPS